MMRGLALGLCVTWGDDPEGERVILGKRVPDKPIIGREGEELHTAGEV